MMDPLLWFAIAVVRGWTRLYTTCMEPLHRDLRRAEIESDLWEFHEDARRRGCSPPAIAVHMFARLAFGIPHDLLWRLECDEETAMPHRRSAWMTAAAFGAAFCIAALWVFFAVTSLASLPPLPDSIHVERIYLQPMRPPPPPPPPPSGIHPVLERRPGPPPPPPPPPPPK
jgi:hypothetical protein